jgi:hypothetical protein
VSEPLPVVQVAAIPRTTGPRWLVESLWLDEAVGIVGGAPKCGKTWLSLDLALSVASGTPALGTFAIPGAGPVLLFAAEDSPAAIRERLEGLALERGLKLEDLPIHAILATSLRLDRLDDQRRLVEAVAARRPRLLILDPFVRLHRIDENSAQEVAAVLAYLRELQREHHVAVLVVHHARKAGAGTGQAGLSLRGSGDLHAWGDSNLYIRRRHGDLELVVEQRSASSPEPIHLTLAAGEHPRLVVVRRPEADPARDSLEKRVLQELERAGKALFLTALRDQLKVRTQTLRDALAALENAGKVAHSGEGWALVSQQREIAW